MKDFLGNELYIGDKVVYTGKNRALEQGIITEVFGRHKVIIDNFVIKIADISVVKVDLNSVNNEKLENALDKACNELSNLCFQTKCKDCHFVKEQEDENNDCPVQGNCCSYDWKEWCLKDE